MSSTSMTRTERRAVSTLSSIMALRMIGLFMVTPVFSLYAAQLPGATPTLIGIALGIYGLSQALFQIPFGALSDRIGRKPIIVFGLLIFSCGSLLAGFAHSIEWLIIGRTLQGVGAIGSTTLALMADLTREDQRTKAMAIAGMTIGLSFAIGMIVGPVLTQWLALTDLFFIATLFGFIAIGVLLLTPTPITTSWHRDTEPELVSFLQLLRSTELLKLNSGIFILHAIFTASFIVIPINLKFFLAFPSNEQWRIYLPTLIIAFTLALIGIGFAERKQQLKPYFLSGILALFIANALLALAPTHLGLTTLSICLFFAGFSLLEAFLPSLVSRTAPAARKGSALGIYSCSQFLGIFAGGICGGWLYGHFSYFGVYLFCGMLLGVWFVIACFMHPPRFLTTRLWRLSVAQQQHWEPIAANLRAIPGMLEVTWIAEDGMAYLKMERETTQHPDFIQLQEQLYSN